MNDLIGRDIGPFRVVRSLEAGSSGGLFEARGAGDRPVRLRILPRAPGISGVVEEIVDLEHPHISGILGSGNVNGFSYIATAFDGGESLRDRRGRGPLPLPELSRLARQLADAIDHAHGRGVVHGSLSSASIRLDEGGDPRITDFGVQSLSDPRRRLAWMDELDGILLYQAPELALGHRPTAQSDLYSLAALLYELATGEPPFRADTPVLLGMKHASDVAPPVSGLRPELGETADRVFRQALAKAPGERFANAGAFADALDAALAPARDQPVTRAVELPAAPDIVPRPKGRVPRWLPPVALALFIWSTLPVMPSLRRVAIDLAGDWVIAVFGTVFFATLGIEAFRRVFWKMRLREELHYWRLFGVVVAYALALLIYGHEPIEQMHLIYYGALGVLIFRAISPPESAKRAHVYAVILVCALGWIDEGIQYLLNVYHLPVTTWLAGVFSTTQEVVATHFHKRYYDLRDVRLNATAGMLGQFALAWWRGLPRR